MSTNLGIVWLAHMKYAYTQLTKDHSRFHQCRQLFSGANITFLRLVYVILAKVTNMALNCFIASQILNTLIPDGADHSHFYKCISSAFSVLHSPAEILIQTKLLAKNLTYKSHMSTCWRFEISTQCPACQVRLNVKLILLYCISWTNIQIMIFTVHLHQNYL